MVPKILAQDIQIDRLANKLNYRAATYLANIKDVLSENKICISRNTPPLGLSLQQVLLYMLYDFTTSHTLFNKLPPGINQTLKVMNQILSCRNKSERTNLMSNPAFIKEARSAMAKVDSVKSGLNYIKGGLKLIIAMVIFAISMEALFYFGIVTVLTFGTPQLLDVSILSAASASAFGLLTILASLLPTALIKDGINQIKQTSRANNQVYDGFGLFKTILSKSNPDSKLHHVSPTPPY